MPLRSYKPTSAGRRFMTRSTFEEITTDEGQIQSVLETVYQPPIVAPEQPAAAPAGGTR